MLTLVLATPRSGSNTFVDELDAPVWMPDDHPGYNKHTEYYNFGILPSRGNDILTLKFHNKLREHIDQKHHEKFVVKVLINQVSSYILGDLLKLADEIHHTVRLDYQGQLKSYVAARHQATWLDNRYQHEHIEVSQQFVNMRHNELIYGIAQHAQVYRAYGGEIHILEQRNQKPYKNKPTFTDSLEWPDFDTAGAFGIHINSV